MRPEIAKVITIIFNIIHAELLRRMSGIVIYRMRTEKRTFKVVGDKWGTPRGSTRTIENIITSLSSIGWIEMPKTGHAKTLSLNIMLKPFFVVLMPRRPYSPHSVHCDVANVSIKEIVPGDETFFAMAEEE